MGSLITLGAALFGGSLNTTSEMLNHIGAAEGWMKMRCGIRFGNIHSK